MAEPLYKLIYKQFQLGPAYHMTHIENLDAIFSSGELKSYNRMSVGYTSLANDDVQAGRAKIVIKDTGRPLHDYVPLYMGFKTPMVATNQLRNEDFVFLRFSLEILAKGGVVISDGNARSNGTKFKEFRQIEDLSILDAKAILALKYAHDPEVKRRKQSEILVPDNISISDILDIICYSANAKSRVLAVLTKHGKGVSVGVNPGWYF